MPTKKIGTRYQVYNSKALKTSGGLTKNALKKNKQGRIVSKKASSTAKQKSNLGTKLYSGKWQKKKPIKLKSKKTKNFDDLWKDPPKVKRRVKKRKQKAVPSKGTQKLTSYFSKK